MTEAERTDLIRDLENACDRVREMYPNAMDAPRPLRRLFNRLVPRAITALRDANAKSALPLITQLADRLGNYVQTYCPECMERFGINVGEHLVEVHGYRPLDVPQAMCAMSSGARVIAKLLIEGSA